MWPDLVSVLGPLAHESDVLPTALRRYILYTRALDKMYLTIIRDKFCWFCIETYVMTLI